MPTNKGKKKADLEAALGRPKIGVLAVTTTTTLRHSGQGVAATAPAAAVTGTGGAAPAVAPAATDRTSSWCNIIAVSYNAASTSSRPSINTNHMVAVIKSSRIEGLTASNARSYWWTTECWRMVLMSRVTLTWNYFEPHWKIGL